MKIENLSFKGGAVLGIAYTGAFQVFEENNLLSNIKNVAGTSAGAITAVFLSLGYTASECQHIIFKKSFEDFKDRHRFLEFGTQYGLHDGNNFLEWMQSFVKEKLGSETATFKDLKQKIANNEKGFRSLSIFATDLNEQGIKVFTSLSEKENILNVPIAEAARASMSIPFFFDAWQFSNKIPDDHLYVDGGVMYNYPLTFFDTNTIQPELVDYKHGEYKFNNKTLGLYLANISGTHDISNLKYGFHFKEYTKDLVNALLNSQQYDLQKHPEDIARTIFIDTKNISPTEFDIGTEDKCWLIKSGIKGTAKKLKELGLIPQSYNIPNSHIEKCNENNYTK